MLHLTAHLRRELALLDTRLRETWHTVSRRTGARLHAVEANGHPLAIDATQAQPEAPATRLPAKAASTLIAEAFRWGEPSFRWLDEEVLCAALPLSLNARLIGGLILVSDNLPEDVSTESSPIKELKAVVSSLFRELIDLNLLDGALMRERAAEARRQRLRAEAIHAYKRQPLREIKRLYWQLEPALFMAMSQKDRPEARRCLNQILMSMYAYAGEDLERMKGFVLELVTMMTRTIVTSGMEPERLPGRGLDHLHTIAAIDDEEALSNWLRETLERLIDIVESQASHAVDFRMQLALNYVREHFHAPLTRDQVAVQVGMSPAHFSRSLKRTLGHSFTDELLRVRLRQASKLLLDKHRTIKEIADACGFSEQAYFSRVFTKAMGVAPSAYRKKH